MVLNAHAAESPELDETVGFRVSTGLKDIIGRDLITDDFVAIFELVKNSFDAGATRVDLAFLDDSIILIDNGKGMSAEDITRKWLFVAYSAKRDGSEDSNHLADYREKIEHHPHYAGSKGIGRFSCDRLGAKLTMFTRTIQDAFVQKLVVDWTKFELDSHQEIYEIPLSLGHGSGFDIEISYGAEKNNGWGKHTLPLLLPTTNGTVLQISTLRSSWDRDKLLALHTHLSKLISPFGEQHDRFQIHVHAPSEFDRDKKTLEAATEARQKEVDDNIDDIAPPPRVVNETVQNFVFLSLAPRTTYLKVLITGQKGEFIESILKDRGKLVFNIREPNPFNALRSSGFSCSLFYLNFASKNVFKRRMGVRSVEFGSVFLFRNGFRVYPIGEEGRDDFGIDRRKQQGYARYLGTRDIIGRIEVQGSPEDFREASSRDHGLIRTPAYQELHECFKEYCFVRLERYVTGVTWSDKLDKEQLDTSRLETSQARLKIIEMLAGFASDKDVEILDFGKDVLEILSARAEEAGLSIDKLRLLAERMRDPELEDQVEKAHERIKLLIQSERQARERAQEERRAREAAETRVELAEREKAEAEKAYKEERKRNLFLVSQSGLDKDVVVDMHHQITIYASNMHQLIEAELRALHSGVVDAERLKHALADIALCNEQVLAASRLATRANFRLDSEEIEDDLATYFGEYAGRVCSLYQSRVKIEVEAAEEGFRRPFKPIDVSIIIDNLVQNAHRAHASIAKISIAVKKSLLEIFVADDGHGLDPSITEPLRIFERGFTTTAGSGLGLHHVKSIVDGMGGSITPQQSSLGGTAFLIRIPK